MRLSGLWFLLLALLPVAAAQDTNFAEGPQYLTTTTSTSFIHSIATPTLNLDRGLSPVTDLPQIGPPVGTQSYVPDSVVTHQADLFPIYYGYSTVPVVELTGTEESPVIPESLNELGFATNTDAQALQERGYGVPLGDAAKYWKAHKRSPRAFTNGDIERMKAK